MEINVLNQTVKINLEEGKHIGVMLSGGMDSAAMLFLILKEIKETGSNVRLSVYNVPNVSDNARYYSARVIEYLENYFNLKIKFENIGDGNAVHNKLVNAPADYLLDNNIVDILYSGQNQFPPVAEQWPSYVEVKDKVSRRNPELPDTPKVRYPFIKLYKHHILEIYRQFNILDLANLTHSCTASTTGKCEICLWCTERAWAFSKLGLTDGS